MSPKHLLSAIVAFLSLLLYCPLQGTAGNGPVDKISQGPQKPASSATLSLPTASVHNTPAADARVGIILLMDSSGSMKRTDPKDYRKAAAKLFISLLGKSDGVGIMSFGDSATLLLPLTQNADTSRKGLFNAVDKITSRELTTNITEAVQRGFDALRSSQAQKRILIMMSDGKLDLGTKEKDAAAFVSLKQLLPELAASNIRLYTMAFTEESDSTLLENMAKETGGFFRFARMDKDVHVMFASIFEKIKSPDTLPFEGESFTIDSDISEATVLVTKKPGTKLSLLDPLKQKNTSAKHGGSITWFESSVFDMITILKPAAGTWSVKLSTNEGNKVYILTNLSLKTSFEISFANRGETIALDAWLERQGGIVTESAVLDNTAFTAEITGPDSKLIKIDLACTPSPSTVQQARGKYSASLPIEVIGEYSIKLIARGKTFTREKTLSFKAVEPPAPPQEKPQEPLPAAPPPPLPTEEELSWTSVLIRFGLVNLVIVGIVFALLGGYVFWKKTALKRKMK